MQKDGKEVAKKIIRGALVVASGAAMVAAPIFSAKATLKQSEIIKDATLTKREKFKKTYKSYIPAAVTVLAGLGCTVASTIMGIKTEAGLTAALAGAKKLYSDYRETTKEVVGEEKAKEIDIAMLRKYAKDTLLKADQGYHEFNSEDAGEQIIIFEPVLCQFIECTPYDIKCAEMAINREVAECGMVQLRELYRSLGVVLAPSSRGLDTLGEDMGWDVEEYMMDYGTSTIEIYVGEAEDVDGMMVYPISYNSDPIDLSTIYDFHGRRHDSPSIEEK